MNIQPWDMNSRILFPVLHRISKEYPASHGTGIQGSISISNNWKGIQESPFNFCTREKELITSMIQEYMEEHLAKVQESRKTFLQ
jgi:uncharacterized protein involved in propanediol utilization